MSYFLEGKREVKSMGNFDVVDLNGKVIKTFPSKNQATKFKKEYNAHGKFGLKVIQSYSSLQPSSKNKR